MLLLKLGVLALLGKSYYMSFIYANLICSTSNMLKRKLNKQLEVVTND
jgi:hypothetical protein